MGASTIPAASGGAPITSWVQLATSSPTSGATVSFTSLASYKQYRVVMSGVDVAAGNPTLSMTLNNTASNYSYAFSFYDTNNAKMINTGGNAVSSININPGSSLLTARYGFSAEILIDFANQATPKSIRYALGASAGYVSQSYANTWAIWNDTSTVNRIDFTLSSSSFVAISTFTVFGSN